jgi:hypothetical protein
VTTFAECNLKDSMQVFFVSLLDFKTRRMVCMTCGDDFDVDDLPALAPASSRPAPVSAPPKRPKPDDPEIDDMLAALKARIGK